MDKLIKDIQLHLDFVRKSILYEKNNSISKKVCFKTKL